MTLCLELQLYISQLSQNFFILNYFTIVFLMFCSEAETVHCLYKIIQLKSLFHVHLIHYWVKIHAIIEKETPQGCYL